MELGFYELPGPFLEAVSAPCCLSSVPVFCSQGLVASRCKGFFPLGGGLARTLATRIWTSTNSHVLSLFVCMFLLVSLLLRGLSPRANQTLGAWVSFLQTFSG